MGSTGKTTTSTSLQSYRGMSVEDAADFVFNTPKNTDPELNSHEKYQDLVNALNLHGKPVVVDDTTFDREYKEKGLDGIALYRGLGNQDDTSVMDSVKFGDKFYAGNGIAGGGLYFTDLYDEAIHAYANGDWNTSVMTAYIDKDKAKVADYKTIYNQFANEPIEVLKKFAKETGTFSITDDPFYLQTDALSAYALYKGYNVIKQDIKDYKGNHDSYHYIVLSREPLVFRDTTPAKRGLK